MPEVRELLLEIERNTMLDEAACKRCINELRSVVNRDPESVTYVSPHGIDELERFLTTFESCFCASSLTVDEQLELLSACCEHMHGDSLVEFVARMSYAKVYTLCNAPDAAESFAELLAQARRMNDQELVVISSIRCSRYEVYVGHYDKAFSLCFEAQNLLEKQRGPWVLEAQLAYQIGLCFAQYNSYDKALQHYRRALELYRAHNKFHFVGHTLNVMANVYANENKTDLAMQCWEECAAIAREHEYPDVLAHALTNMGLTQYETGKLREAHQAIETARDLLESIADHSARAANFLHLALIYSNPAYEHCDDSIAEANFERALELATLGTNKHLISNIYRSRYHHFNEREEWKKALGDYKQYVELEREVFTADVETRVRSMEQEHERKLVLNEQRITSSLLNKVFPASVVERMKHEQHIADSFDNVTVLFADIVGFTPLGSALSPRGVITLLNNVFGIFDAVMKKYGCEKIKTIGDGYMAVAGAPVPVEDHAERMLLAACTLQEALKDYRTVQSLSDDDARAANDYPLLFRIGVHCGPAVGGVVGEERFVYDLYGDTVNTAARMESHSDPGTIHVSDAVLHHLLTSRGVDRGSSDNDLVSVVLQSPERAGLRFVPRGDVAIKGKGTMQTYFVHRYDVDLSDTSTSHVH